MTTNYADDNALSYVHRNAETVIHTLQHDCTSLIVTGTLVSGKPN